MFSRDVKYVWLVKKKEKEKKCYGPLMALFSEEKKRGREMFCVKRRIYQQTQTRRDKK